MTVCADPDEDTRRAILLPDRNPSPATSIGWSWKSQSWKSRDPIFRALLPLTTGRRFPLDGQAVYGEVSAAYNSRVQEYKRKLVQLRADAAAITTASARLMHEERHSLEPHEKSKIGQNCKTTARQRKWSFFV
jgi:hypothetical protein